MVGQRDRAVRALQFLSARPAHDDKRVAAAVEQDDVLLAPFKCFLRFFHQGAGKKMFLTCLLKLTSHVDEFHTRERALVKPLMPLDARLFALMCVMPRFE